MKKILAAYIKGFKEFGLALNNVITLIMLSIVYFVGVGLTSIIAKALKKNFLEFKSADKTYWKENRITKKKFEDYLRTF